MNFISKNRIILLGLLSIVIIGTIFLVLSVFAATTSNLNYLTIDEDWFSNYDFVSEQAGNDNVDWPVTMMFWNNADIDKVKAIFFGSTMIANTRYGYLNDGNGWIWDNDRGTKDVICDNLNGCNYLHMRLYAPNPPDYMSNVSWGRYVLGTTHLDQFPWESWSGYNETAEEYFINIAEDKGYYVYFDWAYFYNPEPFRQEGNHIWNNDGYASAVYVP